MNGRGATHGLTSVVQISAVLDKMPDNLPVAIQTGPCQRRVSVAIFECTSEPVNRRFEIYELTDMVHVGTVADKMLDSLYMTTLAGQCQCRILIFVFECTSESVSGRCMCSPT